MTIERHSVTQIYCTIFMCHLLVVRFHLATGSTLEPVYIMMKKKTPVK